MLVLDHVFATNDTGTAVRAQGIEQLLCYFDAKEETNIVLAKYVSEFISKMMEVAYYEVCGYLLERPARISSIITHMSNVSVAESIVYPLVFSGEQRTEQETSVLEKKLEREARKAIQRPLRAKLFSDLWNRCVKVKDEPDYVDNVLAMLRRAIAAPPKDDSYRSFLCETVYSKKVVGELFELLLSTLVD